MRTAPVSTWVGVLAQAESANDPEEMQKLLNAICIASLPVCGESLHTDRVGGFPRGRPDKLTTRNAAALLIEVTDNDESTQARLRRAVAWTRRHRDPQADAKAGEPSDWEFLEAVRDNERALDEAHQSSDPVIVAIALLGLTAALRGAGDAQRAIKELSSLPEVGQESVGLSYDAPFLPHALGLRLKFRMQLTLFRAHRDMHRMEEALAASRLAADFAAMYADDDPADFSWALALRATVERLNRDVPAFFATEAELLALTAVFPDVEQVWRRWSIVAGSNANRVHDYSRARRLRSERFDTRLMQDLGVSVSSGRMSKAALKLYVAKYREIGSKDGLTWFGNAVYDIAAGIVNSGELKRDPTYRDYVMDLLDIVSDSWHGFANNGVYSVLFSRARLRLVSGDPPTDELVRDLLITNMKARRAGTRDNALVAAVKWGGVGNVAVRERLDNRLLETDPTTSPVSAAKLMGLSAEWWWRYAQFTNYLTAWVETESVSLRAAALLRPAGISVDPKTEAISWIAAAHAVSNVRKTETAEHLRRLLRGVQCVAEVMVTISTAEDRVNNAAEFSELFTDAAELAANLGDHNAVDLIMEAARRDRVGLLLVELIGNPDVSAEIRSAAMAVTDLSAETPDTTPTEDPDSGDSVPPTSGDIGSRSAAIAVDRSAAVRTAESILGPLGALCDSTALARATPQSILDSLGPRTQTTIIVQLLPTSLLCGDPVDEVDVYRRVTIAVPGMPVEEYVDKTVVPAESLTCASDSAEVFNWAEYYTNAVFPQQALDELRLASRVNPVRLMLVPTGFFHIPFDYLPTGPGSMLIDHAIVSVHGSLTSVLSLLALEDRVDLCPSVAVYDRALGCAGAEFEALNEYHDGVTEIGSLKELHAQMRPEGPQSHSFLAMAVHGASDAAGWGQAKILPDQTNVTAAQVLSWTVPRLCVLASCNTPITTLDGIEIGGFPLALMLRGATTVIGGVYEINDQSTSQIMISFWKYLSEGHAAVRALRLAKLDYRNANPVADPELWVGLVTYGAAAN